ncbi:MAG TPA: 1-acyl-sn-glycerol-3-phosphate acyltransferase [Gemmatimonadaceae bacterium]|nr:1-acyl-sn-glycerol-3-phosphate acyltransferase [Gemmatimonadaceae bacterium]
MPRTPYRAARELIAQRLSRIGVRALYRSRGQVARFKFTPRRAVKATLLADPVVVEAVADHARETGQLEPEVWRRVDTYVEEIVPFFSLLAYYRIGMAVSRAILNLFYKISADSVTSPESASLPRDSIVVYLMNHRSNMDYVLVGYLLSGQVAISYAVGEWARTFPLEYIFKSFGAYFIRRRFREKLYHTVLERYVQLITREGVAQGIFLEGGLTRDGKLSKAKIGLLDYIIGVARERELRHRLYMVPVAINYDRVLEDRTLLRELDTREGRPRVSRSKQLEEVASYVWWNFARIAGRRWKRYGRAAVVIGQPVPLAPWLEQQDRETGDLFSLPREARLSRVQELADTALLRIAEIIPVTPVPLACAAIQSFDSHFLSHDELLHRMSEMRDVLIELNGRVIHREGPIEETFDRAWRMLKMRRILARSGDGYAVLPGGEQLVSYYANSIAHLLGPFSEGVRNRDKLAALSHA